MNKQELAFTNRIDLAYIRPNLLVCKNNGPVYLFPKNFEHTVFRSWAESCKPLLDLIYLFLKLTDKYVEEEPYV